MKAVLALFVLCACASSALAQPACDVTGYKRYDFTTPTIVPDGVADGVYIGPIDTSGDTGVIADLAVDVDIQHTYAGDVTLTLVYDPSCDGAGNADDVSGGLLCGPGGVCGGAVVCPAALNGVYSFSVDGDPFPEDQCPTAALLPPGCYLPEAEVGGPAALLLFQGLDKGGCFYLFASDAFTPDQGTVRSWSVHLFNDTGVPAASRSWGEIKSTYK